MSGILSMLLCHESYFRPDAILRSGDRKADMVKL